MTDPTFSVSDARMGPLDAPTDAPLTALEQVIEAALADPVHWRAFEALLPTVDLIVVPEGEFLASIDFQQTGTRTLRPDQSMDLRGLILDDGTTVAAMFTHPRRLISVWGEQAWIAMNARHLLTLFRDRPVLLNPGSARRLLFSTDDVAALLAAATATQGVQRPTGTVQLGMPQHAPEGLVTKLKAAFGSSSGVPAMWLARAHWAEANRWGWMLDVRTERPMDEIKAIVTRAVTGMDFGQDTLDVSVAPPGGGDGSGIRLI